MKEILFIRHAKSDQSLWHTGISDIDRPLNDRGRKDAAMMQKVLSNSGWKTDTVFCSAALRTRQTFELIDNAAWRQGAPVYFEKELYTFDQDDIFTFLRNADNDLKRITLIGHNPALTYAVSRLGMFTLDNLPTTGMVWIQSEALHWDEILHKKGAVLWKAYPSEYRK